MMSRAAILAFAATAIAMALAHGHARAETLPVVVDKPAANDALIGHDVVAVDFEKYSRWGDRWAGELRSRLQGASLLGEKMFEDPLPGYTAGASVVMTGTFYFDTDYVEIEPEIVRKCVAKDEDKKCVEWEETEKPCTRLDISISGSVELYRPETGNSLYNFGDSDITSVTHCGIGLPMMGSNGEYMLDRMVERVADELLPTRRREQVRIMEMRKGLRGADRKAFKDAVRLTKGDPDGACMAFEELSQRNPNHPSILFNMALCEEMRGDHDAAYTRYLDMADVAPTKKYLKWAIERIEQRTEAERQFDLHFASADASDDEAAR